MLIELTAKTVLKNNGTGERKTFEPGEVVDFPGVIANKIIEQGKARPVPGKPLAVPDQCLDCPDGWTRCHICPYGCKIGLIIGKQYPANHIFH